MCGVGGNTPPAEGDISSFIVFPSQAPRMWRSRDHRAPIKTFYSYFTLISFPLYTFSFVRFLSSFLSFFSLSFFYYYPLLFNLCPFFLLLFSPLSLLYFILKFFCELLNYFKPLLLLFVLLSLHCFCDCGVGR